MRRKQISTRVITKAGENPIELGKIEKAAREYARQEPARGPRGYERRTEQLLLWSAMKMGYTPEMVSAYMNKETNWVVEKKQKLEEELNSKPILADFFYRFLVQLRKDKIFINPGDEKEIIIGDIVISIKRNG